MDPAVAATCPSGRCRPGGTLLGIRGADGTLIYSPGLPALDEATVETLLERGGSASFRFAEPCQEGGCGHWDEQGCGVARAAASLAGDLHGDLPRCGIRATCRWFEQEGRRACEVCPRVMRKDAATAPQPLTTPQAGT